jgi:Na+/H+ antiporter NhaD/arsenite permease-like protein
LLGLLLAMAALPSAADGTPSIPVWLIAPFAVLLASIALMPFVHAAFWHRHYPDFSLVLGGIVAGYYMAAFRTHGYGPNQVLHALAEYASFIALVGGLFVVSGGILIEVRARGGPGANTALLAAGAVLANVVGTTGASMLLIRPFLRMNRDRLRPLHVVFFIFIVSNCGGCLTPIGDPPLYLGFLRGVPFLWTLRHLWEDWALTVGLLLVAFFVCDRWGGTRGAVTHRSPVEPVDSEPHQLGVSVRGAAGLIGLGLMVAAVFIDPALDRFAGIRGWPLGAAAHLAIAGAAYRLAPGDILRANEFSFAPAREVGLLFLGIFITMMPALAYLAQHGASLGISAPAAFYFGTGSLSAVLDNAPTYMNFLQLALGPAQPDPEGIASFLATTRGPAVLDAISIGAVFFGAMTYIGNGPNFMVKAIAEASGVRMPSFFVYLGLACAALLPILLAHWAVMIR